MPRVPSAAALVLALVVVPAAAHAETPALSLAEALDYARTHQPQLASAAAELKARRAEARVPRAAWMPQIGASLQLIYGTANNTTASYLNVPEVDLPRIGATRSAGGGSWSPAPSTLAALSIGQEVYDFGRIAAQIAVADAFVDVARAGHALTELDVQLGVEEAFHAVLAAHDVLGATEEAYKRAATHRDFAQAGTKSGLRPMIDLTRAQADLAQLEVRRIRAQTGLQAARAAFAASMGHVGLEVDARALGADEAAAPAFDEALRLAGARNPLIAAARARLRAQAANSDAIVRELAPNIFVSSGLSGRAGGTAPSSGDVPYGDGWLPDVVNWHVGLVLQWNIFDGTVLARRAASRAREEAARADLALARMNVSLAAERSWLELDAAQRTLPGLAEARVAAAANQLQAETRYRAGLGNVVELADAEALLINADLDLAIGRFAVARARAALGRVLAEKR